MTKWQQQDTKCQFCGEMIKNHARCGRCDILIHDSDDKSGNALKDKKKWWLCEDCAKIEN